MDAMYDSAPPQRQETPLPPDKTPFFKIWTRLLFSPSVHTFERFLPEAAMGRAIAWMLVTSAIVSLLTLLPLPFLGRQYWQSLPPELARELPISQMPLSMMLICGFPTSLVLGLLTALALVGLFQLVARLFQGQGTYTETFFLFAAVAAPLGIVTAVLNLIGMLLTQIPVVGGLLQFLFSLITLLVSLYNIVLEAMGVAAAHRFSLGKGFLTVLIPYALVFFLACCLVAALSAIMGASIAGLMRQLPGGPLPPGP